MSLKPIDASETRRGCDLSRLGFQTTADLEPLALSIGQPRALQALKLGVGIEHEGYNIFVLGPPGSGRHALAEKYLRQAAEEQATPPDWCYVNNFGDPRKPKLLEMRAGVGCRLRRDMERFAEELRGLLSAALQSDEYQTRREVIDEEFKGRSEKVFSDLEEEASKRGLAVLRTPMGVAFAPLKEDGEVAPPEEFRKLPEEERQEIQKNVEELQEQLRRELQEAPRWERERRELIRELNREVVGQAVTPLIEELKSRFSEQPSVLEFLDAVEADVIDKHGEILQTQQTQQQDQNPISVGDPVLRRYHVNLLVDNCDTDGAPVVYEDHPTFANLIGRIEHMAQAGVLSTDFTLVKGGSLLRANGGYLVVDVRRLLVQPFAYDGLKRALQAEQVRIESPAESLSLISTISLEPEPVPLDAKVVLIGEPLFYYLLTQLDPDFGELFKVAADFDPEIDRQEEHEELYARLVARLVQECELRPFDRASVERIIEESARMSGDAHKLTARVGELADLLREADYWAGDAGADAVRVEDIEKAVDARTFRLDRVRQRSQELILRETVLIDTTGDKTGQVNGLSVLQMGKFSFGRPSRISARVQLGKGKVLDIEREVNLSGPIHSKGVLILSSFLGARYARDQPLSVSASIVFEQTYGGVDGDSASSTELYALLSALADAPLKQSLAVTGSVNQHGQVQAVGGVNEKIEGFFDLCRARELTGEQGVLIPKSNVQHLMLRRDVVDAIGEGRFHVYAVEDIDQGIELLTGVPAGEPDEQGEYPPESINGKVQRRLEELTEKSRKLAARPGEGLVSGNEESE